MMGRPTKLDMKSAEAIVAALAVGAPVRSACKAAGIGATTFKTWMSRGKSDAPEDAPFRAFRATVKRANAMAQVHALTTLNKAMRNHWQAAAWYLERTDPKRWGRKPVPAEEPKPERPLIVNVITRDTVDPARRFPPPRRTQTAPLAGSNREEIEARPEALAIGSTGATGRP